MQEISREEGKRLIAAQQAGWYAVEANPPIVHHTQYVVDVGDRTFLCPVEEFNIEFGGVVQLADIPKQAHIVECKNDDLAAMLISEMEKVALRLEDLERHLDSASKRLDELKQPDI